jgi:hypothetical protein
MRLFYQTLPQSPAREAEGVAQDYETKIQVIFLFKASKNFINLHYFIKDIKNKNNGNRSTSPPYGATSTIGAYNLGKIHLTDFHFSPSFYADNDKRTTQIGPIFSIRNTLVRWM